MYLNAPPICDQFQWADRNRRKYYETGAADTAILTVPFGIPAQVRGGLPLNPTKAVLHRYLERAKRSCGQYSHMCQKDKYEKTRVGGRMRPSTAELVDRIVEILFPIIYPVTQAVVAGI